MYRLSSLCLLLISCGSDVIPNNTNSNNSGECVSCNSNVQQDTYAVPKLIPSVYSCSTELLFYCTTANTTCEDTQSVLIMNLDIRPVIVFQPTIIADSSWELSSDTSVFTITTEANWPVTIAPGYFFEVSVTVDWTLETNAAILQIFTSDKTLYVFLIEKFFNLEK